MRPEHSREDHCELCVRRLVSKPSCTLKSSGLDGRSEQLEVVTEVVVAQCNGALLGITREWAVWPEQLYACSQCRLYVSLDVLFSEAGVCLRDRSVRLRVSL